MVQYHSQYHKHTVHRLIHHHKHTVRHRMHRHLYPVHHNAVECFMEHKIYSVHHHSVHKNQQVLVDIIQQVLWIQKEPYIQHVHNLEHLHWILLCILLLEKLYHECLLRVNTKH